MLDALEIGYTIKDKRKELDLTQAQVAQAAGVSERCLWSLELGQNPGVQLNKLTAVLGALGLELEVRDTNAHAPKATNTRQTPTTPETPKTHSPEIDALAILTGGTR